MSCLPGADWCVVLAWSPLTPERPSFDPLFIEQRPRLERDDGTNLEAIETESFFFLRFCWHHFFTFTFFSPIEPMDSALSFADYLFSLASKHGVYSVPHLRFFP